MEDLIQEKIKQKMEAMQNKRATMMPDKQKGLMDSDDDDSSDDNLSFNMDQLVRSTVNTIPEEASAELKGENESEDEVFE